MHFRLFNASVAVAFIMLSMGMATEAKPLADKKAYAALSRPIDASRPMTGAVVSNSLAKGKDIIVSAPPVKAAPAKAVSSNTTDVIVKPAPVRAPFFGNFTYTPHGNHTLNHTGLFHSNGTKGNSTAVSSAPLGAVQALAPPPTDASAVANSDAATSNITTAVAATTAVVSDDNASPDIADPTAYKGGRPRIEVPIAATNTKILSRKHAAKYARRAAAAAGAAHR